MLNNLDQLTKEKQEEIYEMIQNIQDRFEQSKNKENMTNSDKALIFAMKLKDINKGQSLEDFLSEKKLELESREIVIESKPKDDCLEAVLLAQAYISTTESERTVVKSEFIKREEIILNEEKVKKERESIVKKIGTKIKNIFERSD